MTKADEVRRVTMRRTLVSRLAGSLCALAIGATGPGEAVAGSVWLEIGEPNAAPRSGETFQTSLRYTTWDASLGAYLVTLFYDSDVIQIENVTSNRAAEFSNTTFVDRGSFSTGMTALAAYQIQRETEQTTPAVLADVTWTAVGSPGDTATIVIGVENVIDTNTRSVEVISNPLTVTLKQVNDPGGGGGGGCAVTRPEAGEPGGSLVLVWGLLAFGMRTCTRAWKWRLVTNERQRVRGLFRRDRRKDLL